MASQVDLRRNPIWVQRVEGFFDSMELNKNGLLSIDEILKWADNLEKICKVTPDETKALRDTLREMWDLIDLNSGIELNKKQFVEGCHHLAKEELKKEAKGELPYHSKQNNAFFDVIDVNNDGPVSRNEVRTMMKACNYDEGAADAWFDAADINKDGRIDREELNKVDFDYWFRPNPSNGGRFGGLFEYAATR